MKALSIAQPWSWLITNGYKDIENRDWDTRYRGLVLIHAGKKLDADIINTMTGQWMQQTMPGHWKEAWATMPVSSGDFPTGGIVGYATLKEVVTKSDSPWFRGKYGFVLTQRHPLPFIPLRGQLYLFDVPVEVEAQVNKIRDERAWEEDMKDMAQIKQEWRNYRLEGDETPPWK